MRVNAIAGPFLRSGAPEIALRNVVIVLLAALLLKNATGYLASIGSVAIQENVVRYLRVRLFKHLQTLPLGYFQRTRAGQIVARYGLVVVLAWIGFGKYVKMEARVLIEHSPLMSWIYDYLSVTTVARGLGTMEIVAALLIALRPLWPRASAVGSALAVVLFLGTLSFLFTTPGVVATHAAGLPVLSAQPGQFLLKDLVLIGVAIWTLGDSLRGAVPSAADTDPT